MPGAFRASLLLGVGEALFTGLLTILITVYKPAWITTYDDAGIASIVGHAPESRLTIDSATLHTGCSHRRINDSKQSNSA